MRPRPRPRLSVRRLPRLRLMPGLPRPRRPRQRRRRRLPSERPLRRRQQKRPPRRRLPRRRPKPRPLPPRLLPMRRSWLPRSLLPLLLPHRRRPRLRLRFRSRLPLRLLTRVQVALLVLVLSRAERLVARFCPRRSSLPELLISSRTTSKLHIRRDTHCISSLMDVDTEAIEKTFHRLPTGTCTSILYYWAAPCRCTLEALARRARVRKL